MTRAPIDTGISIVKQAESGWTAISNEVIRNPDIPMDVRCAWAIMRSLPPDWVFRVEPLRRMFGVGRDRYYRIWNDLQEHELMVVRQGRDPYTHQFLQRETWILPYPGAPVPDDPDADPPNTTKKEKTNPDKTNTDGEDLSGELPLAVEVVREPAIGVIQSGNELQFKQDVALQVAYVCRIREDEISRSVRKRLMKAARELIEMGCRDLNEVTLRATVYRATYGDISLTPEALVKHWPQMHSMQPSADRLQRDAGWAEFLAETDDEEII